MSLVLCLWMSPLPAEAASVTAGDILVSDPFNGRIYVIPLSSGVPEILFEGGLLVTPRELALDSQGSLWVSDIGTGSIIHIEIATGTQTPVPGGLVGEALAYAPSGYLFSSSSGYVERVDPQTGARTTWLSQQLGAGPLRLGFSRALAFDGAGNLYAMGSTGNGLATGTLVVLAEGSPGAPTSICGGSIPGPPLCEFGYNLDGEWDPVGGRLVVAANGVVGVDVSNGTASTIAFLPSTGASSIAVTDWGLIAASDSATVYLVNAPVVGFVPVATMPAGVLIADIEFAPVSVATAPEPVPALPVGGAMILAVAMTWAGSRRLRRR